MKSYNAVREYCTRPLFLVLCTLFVASWILDRTGIAIPIIHSWLDDILALPLGLSLVLLIQRFVTYRKPAYILPLWQVAFAWLAFSIWFEWVLPAQATRFTSDPLDLIAYAIGGALFWFFLNKPQRATTDAVA